MEALDTPGTKTILLVDDDALILRVFKEGLVRHGFQVQTANDGLEALKALHVTKPDLVVLDLMMPKFTGADVVNFIRTQPELADIPIIVLSNGYIDELAQAVHAAGVQEALLKSRCTPSALVDVIRKTLEPNTSAKSSLREARDFNAKARHDFLANGGQICSGLRELCDTLKSTPTAAGQGRRLEDLYRKTHFVTAAAGLAGCSRIEKMGSAFEALLFVLMDKPGSLSPSVWRTVNMSIEFLDTLFQESGECSTELVGNARVLVVDDDAVSNRVIISTLRRVDLAAYGFQDPLEAFRSLETIHYDLILLDIEMPGLDGFEFCRQTRGLPLYRKTPIVYVTNHSDFESHAEGLLSGGTDLIAKPIFPMELAVKTVIHLLRKDSEGS
jgi:CheY-like chemotaxis protein